MFDGKKMVKGWEDYIDGMEELNKSRLAQFKSLAKRVEALGSNPIPKSLEKELLAFSQELEASCIYDITLCHMSKVEQNKRNEESWRKGIAELVKVKRNEPNLPVTFHEQKSTKSYGIPDAEA